MLARSLLRARFVRILQSFIESAHINQGQTVVAGYLRGEELEFEAELFVIAMWEKRGGGLVFWSRRRGEEGKEGG